MTITAFVAHQVLATGDAATVVDRVLGAYEGDAGTAVQLFDDETGAQIEVDRRCSAAANVNRLTGRRPASNPKRGRPKLGVVAREVTLLPRHWEWLAQQRGGASAALRRLVDDARKQPATAEERVVRAQHATAAFLAAMAGDLPGFEEANRALFGRDGERFMLETRSWPADVRRYAGRLAAPAFIEWPLAD